MVKSIIEKNRRIIVSKHINSPDPFEGYGGFNGWHDTVCLSDGDLLMAFNAGYWHNSPPTPYICKPPELLKNMYAKGFPRNHIAPRGGRIMVTRSTDGGITWNKPVTLIDTKWDDQEPSFLELDDKHLLMTFRTLADWRAPKAPPDKRTLMQRLACIHSYDSGYSWQMEDDMYELPTSCKYRHCASAPAIKLSDDSLLFAAYAHDGKDGKKDSWYGIIHKSEDYGKSWREICKITQHNIDEPALGLLPDGRIILVNRDQKPDGAFRNSTALFSCDGGFSWGGPVDIGCPMCAPHLLVLKNGIIVVIFGPPGGLRVIFSRNIGQDWSKGPDGNGFKIDPTVYGYPSGCELPDGSVLITYYDGWNLQTDTAIWMVRIKIDDEKNAIRILPAPGIDKFIQGDYCNRSKEMLKDIDDIKDINVL